MAEQWAVVWMEGQPAPEPIIDLMAYICPKKCTLPKCACMANGFKCTDMCKLVTTSLPSQTVKKMQIRTEMSLKAMTFNKIMGVTDVSE